MHTLIRLMSRQTCKYVQQRRVANSNHYSIAYNPQFMPQQNSVSTMVLVGRSNRPVSVSIQQFYYKALWAIGLIDRWLLVRNIMISVTPVGPMTNVKTIKMTNFDEYFIRIFIRCYLNILNGTSSSSFTLILQVWSICSCYDSSHYRRQRLQPYPLKIISKVSKEHPIYKLKSTLWLVNHQGEFPK